jgi:hypothetical protein
MSITKIRASQIAASTVTDGIIDAHIKPDAEISQSKIAGLSEDLTALQTNIFAISYHHIQSLADTDWVIQHNLNKLPTIVVADDNGQEVIGDVVFTGLQQITVSFNIPISGQAYLT